MIRIYLSFYGNLIRYKADPFQKELEIEINPGDSLEDIAQSLGMKKKEAQMLICAGKRVNWDFTPAENDRIKFYSLMSGG